MSAETELLQSGYRFALSLTHHHYDAEDLVQQAWLKLHNKYGGVTERPLLFTTIRNLFRDKCRRNKIVVFEPLEDKPEPSAPPNIAAGSDLDILLSSLRVEERESLYLNVVEGYTAQEISEMTGSPRGTVLSLIHRAKKKLARAHGADETSSKIRKKENHHE